MVTDDFNEDGFADILMHGNFYNTEIEITRHDAGNGLLLYGKGDGTFAPARGYQTGFKSDGDAKGLACVLDSKTKQPVYLLANSNGKMESYGLLKSATIIELASNDAYAIVSMKDGKKSKVELYLSLIHISEPTRPY